MKIIFLDVDGVLNGYNRFSYAYIKLMRLLHIKYDIFSIHKRKFKKLVKIVKRTGAKVVISSSWRGAYFDPYNEKSARQKCLADYIEKYSIEVVGSTPRISTEESYSHRASEIKYWLGCHPEVSSFVILDDESSDLLEYKDRLVQTAEIEDGEIIKGSWYENTGLKRKHVKEAIDILSIPIKLKEE